MAHTMTEELGKEGNNANAERGFDMNNKPKTEQIFILLAVLVACFGLIAAAGCDATPTVKDGFSGELHTCGKNSCIGCGVTCGTVGDNLYWDCGKETGCTRYGLGCGRGQG
jgi:ABC-type xylose transport system permease subunit